jgi:hypothetical protein
MVSLYCLKPLDEWEKFYEEKINSWKKLFLKKLCNIEHFSFIEEGNSQFNEVGDLKVYNK